MTGQELQERYTLKGNLTLKKVYKYLPFLVMTNLSNLLLVSVDGLVVGNFVGQDALSSINIFYPIITVIGVMSSLVATGIGTSLSICMGESNQAGISRLKHAAKILMFVSSIIVAIVQVPVVFALIKSIHLSESMEALTIQYAIGLMISFPFGLISTVGVYELQILGKMRALMVLAITEGGVNLVMDLLLVGAFKMGIAGAGYGTAIANVVRATTTLIYLWKKTDIFDSSGIKSDISDFLTILKNGIPEAANAAIGAFQNYIMLKIIISAFGEPGGSIKGVLVFTMNIAFVFVNGLQGSMRPLVGLLSGATDWQGLRLLMRQGAKILTVVICIYIVLVNLFPSLFFTIHGVKTIPDGGITSLRIFTAFFLFSGYDTLYRLYYANRGEVKYSSLLTTLAGLTMPIFALIFYKCFGSVWLWASYLATECIIIAFNTVKYFKHKEADAKAEEECIGQLYMTVKPDEAVEASRSIRNYAKERGLSERIAYRIALCMEEMVAYAVESQHNEDINIQIVIRFMEDESVFMMIDDGKCIALDKDIETRQLITDNYNLLKKVAKTVKYQYVLDLNYTIFTF